MVAAGGKNKKTEYKKHKKKVVLVVMIAEPDVLCLGEVFVLVKFLVFRFELRWLSIDIETLEMYTLTQCTASHSPTAQTQGCAC